MHIAIADLFGLFFFCQVPNTSEVGTGCLSICRGSTQYARQIHQPEQGEEEEVPDADKIPSTPPRRSSCIVSS